ncbi:Gliotoxin biosynthesis protein [Pleurostoma richardsiae]|uniref:gamma-glutamylcyclotransferase n=1 Tax=Pleurostoma richardsiae TaxID=41990 RepID=A0AA38RTC6_9PEZI|nr:Gliotoxin biosynthesis protein [Pleurostoma richardsiae]
MTHSQDQTTRGCPFAGGILHRFCDLNIRPAVERPDYPPVSSIPRTSAERLASASPTPCPDEPIPCTSADDPDSKASTILYLAYGSNLSAETFLGRRGIRPLSQLNVSAPSLRLTFDLPGIPYTEPCFANTAPRKIPKLPPIPPKLPDPPTLGDRDTSRDDKTGIWEDDSQEEVGIVSHGDPIWDKGLIGVVYEVSPADYRTIIKTEGGGSSYREILVPCLELPPAVSVPEKPPFPVPRPFIARTLYAPQIPPTDGDNPGDEEGQQHKQLLVLPAERACEPGDPVKKIKDWWRRLLLKPVRPDPEYAQPSARYLRLIRDGAREHELPAEYQAWLATLQPYTITTLRQRLGQVVVLAAVVPLMLVYFTLETLLADKDGKVPAWLAVALAGSFRLIWLAYDTVLKPVFGDGERTVENEDNDGDRLRRTVSMGADGGAYGEKMNLLTRDW